MNLGQRLYDSIFPKSFELKPKEQQLLQMMYPQIDWKFVRYYDGLPWFMKFTSTIGTALPHSYSGRFIHVYFKDYHKMSIYQSTLILVHEAFHIQQYQELGSMGAKSSGWGFFRRFMQYYLGWYFQGFFKAIFKDKKKWSDATQYAYRQHPMEIPAYDHEADFEKEINLYKGHAVPVFFQQKPNLIRTDVQLPERPSLVFWLMGSGLALFICLVKPLMELPLALVAFILSGFRRKL